MSLISSVIKSLSKLSMIGRALMLPISLLPAAGLLLAFGDKFHLPLMMNAGGIIFDNLPMLFAIGSAVGLASESGIAALSAAVSVFVTNITISTLKVDGGASRDHFLMQFQSDILNKEVLRPAIRETTALGAAYLAGLATGVWKSREEISHLWSCNQLFEPKMDAVQREKLVRGWHKAVGRSQDWAEHEV